MQRLIYIFEYNEYIRHDWLDCHEEAYVWVSEYSLHHHFIVDFIQQFLSDPGVEYLFNHHLVAV